MEKQLNVTLDSKVENVKRKNKSPESVRRTVLRERE